MDIQHKQSVPMALRPPAEVENFTQLTSCALRDSVRVSSEEAFDEKCENVIKDNQDVGGALCVRPPVAITRFKGLVPSEVGSGRHLPSLLGQSDSLMGRVGSA